MWSFVADIFEDCVFVFFQPNETHTASLKGLDSLFSSRVISDTTTPRSSGASSGDKENVKPSEQRIRRGLFRSPSTPRLFKSHSLHAPVSSSPLLLCNRQKQQQQSLSNNTAAAASNNNKRSEPTDCSEVHALRLPTKRRRADRSEQTASDDSSSCDSITTATTTFTTTTRLRVSRPLLHRSQSSEADIKSALNRLSSCPDLVGDMSRGYALPRCQGKHNDLKAIDPATVSSYACLFCHNVTIVLVSYSRVLTHVFS